MQGKWREKILSDFDDPPKKLLRHDLRTHKSNFFPANVPVLASYQVVPA